MSYFSSNVKRSGSLFALIELISIVLVFDVAYIITVTKQLRMTLRMLKSITQSIIAMSYPIFVNPLCIKP